MYALPSIAVITRPTRLAGLQARWNTVKQAAFRMQQAVEHEVDLRRKRMAKSNATIQEDEEAQMNLAANALADVEHYQDEDETYQRAIEQVVREIDFDYPVRTVDRGFLPNFDFGRCLAVVVLGQDGLVANAAKYVGDLPIVGINPNPGQYDGVLLPFGVEDARSAVRQAIERKAKTRDVTLAEATTNDGQHMLAFNDFFIGSASHVSARYTLDVDTRSESQSSSGVLVSTGAGSTGWLSSLFNMAEGISRCFDGPQVPRMNLSWEDRKLIWAVREPFQSKHSDTNLVAGVLVEGDELVIGSEMPTGGVIFSDGVEDDFLEFNSGTIARFTISSQRARLVVKS